MNNTSCRPQEVKFHPSSVDLELVKRLAVTTKCSTLVQFLVKEFSSIPRALAGMWSTPGRLLLLLECTSQLPHGQQAGCSCQHCDCPDHVCPERVTGADLRDMSCVHLACCHHRPMMVSD